MNYQGLMEITKIENIADDVYEMTLKGEGAKYISQPGQFITLRSMKVYNLILEDQCLFLIMMKIQL